MCVLYGVVRSCLDAGKGATLILFPGCLSLHSKLYRALYSGQPRTFRCIIGLPSSLRVPCTRGWLAVALTACWLEDCAIPGGSFMALRDWHGRQGCWQFRVTGSGGKGLKFWLLRTSLLLICGGCRALPTSYQYSPQANASWESP